MKNLIDNPEYKDEIATHRKMLGEFMEKTNDPVFAAFQKREDTSYLYGFVEALHLVFAHTFEFERQALWQSLVGGPLNTQPVGFCQLF